MSLDYFYSKPENENEDKIEYDDEAIFAFSPETRHQHEVLQKILQESLKEAPSCLFDDCKEKTKSETEPLSEKVQSKVNEMISGPLQKISKVKEEILSLTNELKQIRKDFKSLESTCFEFKSKLKGFEKDFAEMNADLDVMIYQNRVIKHLMEAGEKIKLFRSVVTHDKKIVILEPEDFGTSVDGPRNDSVVL